MTTLTVPALRRLAAPLLLVLIAAAAGLTGRAQAQLFEPETFTLDNGLQVVVVTNRSAPAVSHFVWYRVGAADEPPGQSGIAHFLEHLMFRGTEAFPAGEFNRLLTANGASYNAFTSWDYTAYFETIAADRLALAMELEADRMVNLVLDAELIEAERQVVIEERRETTDNDPSSQLGEQMYAALYLNHPYGTPIIGWEHEIEQITLEQIEAFYRRWYAPNNAILVVTGDIDAATLRPLAEQYYGVIPPGPPAPTRARLEEPAAMLPRTVTLEDARVQQPDWSRLYQAPSYNEDLADAHALQVLNEILGSGYTSRLYRALVIDQQIAIYAGSYYWPTAVDGALFGLYVEPTLDTDPDLVAAAVEAEIARLLQDGIDAAEFERARDRLVLQSAYALDGLSTPARLIGRALATDGDLDQVEAWADRIAAVTVEQVMAAAQRVFDPNRSVTGVLLPLKSEETRS